MPKAKGSPVPAVTQMKNVTKKENSWTEWLWLPATLPMVRPSLLPCSVLCQVACPESGLTNLKMAPTAPQIEWGLTGRISNFLLGASIPSGFWWVWSLGFYFLSCPSYFALSPLVRTVLRPIRTLEWAWGFTTGIFSLSPDTIWQEYQCNGSILFWSSAFPRYFSCLGLPWCCLGVWYLLTPCWEYWAGKISRVNVDIHCL
jgi:hypothetical protein